MGKKKAKDLDKSQKYWAQKAIDDAKAEAEKKAADERAEKERQQEELRRQAEERRKEQESIQANLTRAAAAVDYKNKLVIAEDMKNWYYEETGSFGYEVHCRRQQGKCEQAHCHCKVGKPNGYGPTFVDRSTLRGHNGETDD